MNREEFRKKVESYIPSLPNIASTRELRDFFDKKILEGEFPGKKAEHCLARLDNYRSGRGMYQFSSDESLMNLHIKETSDLTPEVLPSDSYEDVGVIPDKDSLYVPFGFHNKLKKIISSGIFYPIFITGMSGNGKTKSVQQVCAELKRKFIRVNITAETDESDLIGGYKLKNGNTVFEYGPIIAGMREGAVVLIDEVDLASSRIMSLQSILEGSPYHIKKTGEYINPTPGFTIVATANTKGKGSDDGRFIGTNILNEAFLERFVITVEQEYPTEAVEKKILNKLFDKYDIKEEDFVEKLVRWAKLMRDAFNNGSVDEIITTRRLVHIAKTYAIFTNKMESIKYCLNRFDEETKAVFIDAYSKIDGELEEPQEETPTTAEYKNDFELNHPF